MDSKFQTSFIPKGSFGEGSSVKNKTPINVLFVVASVITFVTILAAGAVFGYQVVLQRQIAAKEAEILTKNESVDYAGIQEVQTFDNKLKSASTLLSKHTDVTNLFALIQKTTLKNLRFNSFNFSYLSNNKVSVSMSGKAKNFGVVAKQQELFASSTDIKDNFINPVFSDFKLDDAGNVSFNFVTTVDTKLIDYKINGDTKATATQTEVTASTTANVATTTASTTKKTTP